MLLGKAYHLPHTAARIYCRTGNFGYRSLSYASRRKIYYAFQSLVVRRVHTQPEVRNGILYLLTLVKRKPTVNSVGDIALAQRLLKYSALSVGAVKNCKLLKRVHAAHLHL